MAAGFGRPARRDGCGMKCSTGAKRSLQKPGLKLNQGTEADSPKSKK